MHIAFLNPQGNFDPQDRYWTAHPDFGGQLVYVKEAALALGRLGHHVDIVTRLIKDAAWPGFDSPIDGYPGEPNVRIVRLPCGGDRFLRKEALWPHLGPDWVPAIAAFYAAEGTLPDVAAAHYGDGGLAAALWQTSYGGPNFTFTAHSLGAHKLDGLLKMGRSSLEELDAEFSFARRIAAERVAIRHAARIITSTYQEQREHDSHVAYADALPSPSEAAFAVIPPGVNLEIFGAAASSLDEERAVEQIRRALVRDIAPDRRHLPVVLCSSRLETRKNHAGLVCAFAQSRELQAVANLLIVTHHRMEDLQNGVRLSPDERAVLDGILALCDAAELWGKVSIISLTSQRELAAAYRHLAERRSVFALTAFFEPFGLAPLEAMAAGLPAVVTRNGGPSETLIDALTGTEYGVLIDPSSPGAIAKGLLQLLTSRDQWETYHRAGMRRVREQYTWERTARGYLAVFNTLTAGVTPPRGGPIPGYFLTGDPADAPGIETLVQHTSGGV